MKWIKTFCYGLLMLAAFQLFLNMVGLQWLELIDIAAMAFVLSGLCLSLTQYPLSQVMRAFGQGAGMSAGSDEELELSSEILLIMGRYAMLAGALGTLLGTVYSLSNLDDLSQLGNGLAISIICLIYGLLINFLLLYPLQVSLKHQRLERSLS